jgi:hypothetical protein
MWIVWVGTRSCKKPSIPGYNVPCLLYQCVYFWSLGDLEIPHSLFTLFALR